MYSLDDIKKGIRHPRAVGRELNRYFYRLSGTIGRSTPGTNIFDEDWDNLLLLDACRYDTFCSMTRGLEGRTESRISRGAATYEFIEENFAGKQLHDVVYVSANKWFLKLHDSIGAEVHDFVDLQDSGTEEEFAVPELNVPRPTAVTKAAREAHKRYPNKRLIVHYLQPHHPFIGEKGREWFTHQSSSLTEVIDQTPDATRSKVREAYRENLRLVLPEVEALIDELSGRTVVTADHGEMLGDRHEYVPTRDYGHHEGIYNDVLVKVPWHVVESEQRKEIVADPPRELDVSEDAVDERLRDLGYVV